MKRQRVIVDSKDFQAHPVMSFLKSPEQVATRLTPRYRASEPLPGSGHKARLAQVQQLQHVINPTPPLQETKEQAEEEPKPASIWTAASIAEVDKCQEQQLL